METYIPRLRTISAHIGSATYLRGEASRENLRKFTADVITPIVRLTGRGDAPTDQQQEPAN